MAPTGSGQERKDDLSCICIGRSNRWELLEIPVIRNERCGTSPCITFRSCLDHSEPVGPREFSLLASCRT
jgi:hypothetical protein